MAPPEKTFRISELENEVHIQTIGFKDKSRKLGRDFNLKDCELFELVQYSCTTQREQERRALDTDGPMAPGDCYPFVRLFRRCQQGTNKFHVETTAWEGRHAWKSSKRLPEKQQKPAEPQRTSTDDFANYGSYFWSGK